MKVVTFVAISIFRPNWQNEIIRANNQSAVTLEFNCRQLCLLSSQIRCRFLIHVGNSVTFTVIRSESSTGSFCVDWEVLNEAYFEHWQGLSGFGSEQWSTYQRGAYYTIVNRAGLRVISYNSNYGYTTYISLNTKSNNIAYKIYFDFSAPYWTFPHLSLVPPLKIGWLIRNIVRSKHQKSRTSFIQLIWCLVPM